MTADMRHLVGWGGILCTFAFYWIAARAARRQKRDGAA